MLRMLFIFCAVVTLSYAASNMDYAQADRATLPKWVRTVDGWEPASVLSTEISPSLPSLHPFLVAGFQLGASLFVLLAFPGSAAPRTHTAAERTQRGERGGHPSSRQPIF